MSYAGVVLVVMAADKGRSPRIQWIKSVRLGLIIRTLLKRDWANYDWICGADSFWNVLARVTQAHAYRARPGQWMLTKMWPHRDELSSIVGGKRHCVLNCVLNHHGLCVDCVLNNHGRNVGMIRDKSLRISCISIPSNPAWSQSLRHVYLVLSSELTLTWEL